MKTYRIQNRVTKKWWEGEAESPAAACKKAGWMFGFCWVRERTPVVPDPTSDSGHSGGGWKTVYRLT